MIPFEEGYKTIAALAQPLASEAVPLEQAFGRVLREDVIAGRPQPASAISAMDGYALAGAYDAYKLMGEVAAGTMMAPLSAGEAARIFTGATIPNGADRVLIQENAKLDAGFVRAEPLPAENANIRAEGLDFQIGFRLASPRTLGAGEIALIAAMNQSEVQVSRKPRIAIIATGSELVPPGQATTPQQVIASNAYGLKALAESYGAEACIFPIVKDHLEEIAKAISEAEDFDLVVTTGGASVGKYDYAARAAAAAGFEIVAHKIAMRPGKPVIAGKSAKQVYLGLPGNPVSAMVTASIFLRALILGFLNLPQELPQMRYGEITHDVEANGDRLHFMRGAYEDTKNGARIEVFSKQDSSLLSVFCRANILVMRPAFAEFAAKGSMLPYIIL